MTSPRREISMSEDAELRFEDALSQLEQIVEALERGEPELTAALDQYEKGVRLLSQSYAILERAERSVALLTGIDDQGNPITAPFDATATIECERVGERERGSSSPAGTSNLRPAAARKSVRSRQEKPSAQTEPNSTEPPF
jgi:exodeoxyribonuclease VII small subunit